MTTISKLTIWSKQERSFLSLARAAEVIAVLFSFVYRNIINFHGTTTLIDTLCRSQKIGVNH